MRSDRQLAAIVAAIAFLALAPGAFFGIPAGGTVVGATRVLSGELPYRDFHAPCAPGTLYLEALLFGLLGRSLAVQALALAVLRAGSSAALLLLLRRAGVARGVASASAAVLALSAFGTGLELAPHEPALLLILLAFHGVLPRRLLRAGLWLGAAAIFEHRLAACAVLGASIALLSSRRSPLRLLAGALLVVLPAAAILARAAGRATWLDLAALPSAELARTATAGLALLSAVLFGLAWPRSRVPGRAALAAAGAILALFLLASPARAAKRMLASLPGSRLLGFPGAALALVPAEEHLLYRRVVSFVRANVPEGEPIYVGAARHDASAVSAPCLYFLCDRPPCTRFHELDPRIIAREDVQTEIACAIDALSVRCLVLVRSPGAAKRDQDVRESPRAGSRFLDDWIAEHFDTALEAGPYRILWLRPAAESR